MPDPATMAAGEFVGIIGQLAAMANSLRAQGMNERDIQKALANAYNIPVPQVQDLMMQAEQMGTYGDIAPGETRSAQMNALRQLSNVAATGGMDAGSVAALQQAQAQAARQSQAQRQGVEAQMERRGMLNSGAQYGGQLAASQSAANALSMAGTQAVADARQRALQAMLASGQMAGGVRSADEQLALANREAQMARDRFNTQLRQSANQFNALAPATQAQLANQRAGTINAATQGATGTRSGDTERTNRRLKDFTASVQVPFGSSGEY